MSFDEGQSQVVTSFFRTDSGPLNVLINGVAGTGKSSTTISLRLVLPDDGHRVSKAPPTAPTARFCIVQVRTRDGSTFRDVLRAWSSRWCVYSAPQKLTFSPQAVLSRATESQKLQMQGIARMEEILWRRAHSALHTCASSSGVGQTACWRVRVRSPRRGRHGC